MCSFDNIDHTILTDILRENIQDNRFIRLIENALKVGYCEEWTYHPSLSGSPQGGIVSPILSNIYMDRLDKFVEHTLIPEYTQGDRREQNRAYQTIGRHIAYLRKKGDLERIKTLRKEQQTMPYVDPNDPGYKRLRYVRYADDFLIGLIGPMTEAEEIKERLKSFLNTTLHLTLAAEKTLITHAQTSRARFLGYEIGTMWSQTRVDEGHRRVVRGTVGLYIPEEVIQKKRQRYLRDGKEIHRPELQNNSEYDIIACYQGEYRGLVNYYGLAQNIHSLRYVHRTMHSSLLKTIAGKNRTTVGKTVKRFAATVQTPDGPRRCLKLTIPREGKKPLVAIFGGIPLRRKKDAVIRDQVILPYTRTRSELVERLLHDTCEVCESKERIQMHHIRKLANLNKQGRREKPLWMKIMIARKRKSIPLCKRCHDDIHFDRPKLKRQGNRRAG